VARVPRPLAEALDYLEAIGWEELHSDTLRPPRRAPGPSPRKSVVPSPPAEPAAPALVGASLDARRADHERLHAAALSCRACALCEKRRTVVFGAGEVGARLMFVGEGPGADEDRQGEPFVGRAGALLNKIIGALEMKREDTYIANIVKCRPPGNRDPLPDEVAACRDYLDRQIDLVGPQVLVALGRVAAHALLGTEGSLASLRGRWFDVRGVPTIVTYHPAAMLRNAAYKRPAWEDFQKARERMLQAP